MEVSMIKPSVTVVIPAYNASSFIEETIASVLSQTFTNFEVLVVDDGSTDDTAAIIDRISQQDKRVQLISQSNQGVSVARNHGLQAAQGELIAFLDSDDLWLPNKLEVHVRHFAKNSRLGMSYGIVGFMDADGKPTAQQSNPRLIGLTPEYLYSENPAVTPSNAVIRKEALLQVGGFDKTLSGCADAELFLRLAYNGWQVEGLNHVLIWYRTSTGGMSAQLEQMEADWHRLTQKVKTYAPELVEQNHNQALAMLLRYLARRSLRLSLEPQWGIRYMHRALSLDWLLIFKEPRRTILTLLAVYAKYLTPKFSPTSS